MIMLRLFDSVGLNHRPYPYQLKSGDRLMKVREVNEGCVPLDAPGGTGPGCCHLVLSASVPAHLPGWARSEGPEPQPSGTPMFVKGGGRWHRLVQFPSPVSCGRYADRRGCWGD
jgi:hypothetical protein